MGTDARHPYSPQQREAALAIYQEHGPAVASRETGIKRGTISSWAKRPGLTSPQAGRTKAAQEWTRRRVVA